MQKTLSELEEQKAQERERAMRFETLQGNKVALTAAVATLTPQPAELEAVLRALKQIEKQIDVIPDWVVSKGRGKRVGGLAGVFGGGEMLPPVSGGVEVGHAMLVLIADAVPQVEAKLKLVVEALAAAQKRLREVESELKEF